MPNTNKIQLILAGAFMPDYYSSLATHFMNIWVEFESTGRYNGTQKLGFKSESNPKDTNLKVCSIYSTVVDRYALIVNGRDRRGRDVRFGEARVYGFQYLGVIG